MKIGYILDRGNDNSNLIKKMKIQGVNKIIVDLNLDQDQYQTMLLESFNSMMENDILVINTLDDLGDSLEDMVAIKEVIKTLKKNEKLSIVYGENEELFQGYVSDITDNHLILHEYVSDVYRTFNISKIMEINRI
ncbi:hypothetical protein [Heyndrickxia ginsengihumi]|uniref:hypothetical protein n=1 Tax=Heyndrickxia ginsengihumi TaxID=363870 RepID=UPI003D1CE0DD